MYLKKFENNWTSSLGEVLFTDTKNFLREKFAKKSPVKYVCLEKHIRSYQIHTSPYFMRMKSKGLIKISNSVEFIFLIIKSR